VLARQPCYRGPISRAVGQWLCVPAVSAGLPFTGFATATSCGVWSSREQPTCHWDDSSGLLVTAEEFSIQARQQKSSTTQLSVTGMTKMYHRVTGADKSPPT
jgi:hypothetical protein